ncbi:UPF0149 family protein [Microbulbifer sp. SAOS-129_SWC]|uniref:UPF0149 family protein n=1 Tax=Microbulbifer sp. SAOS-129_SWC TaxID=3145235 RepID=UPI0032180571
MTAPDSPFDSLANTILAAGGVTGPGELHGFVCGMLCAGARPDPQRWQHELAELLQLEAVPAELNREFLQLAERSLEQLGSGAFDLQLLLADDEDITVRARSLGSWCQGFLLGFGLGDQKGKLAETSSEALQDIGNIAQLDAEVVDASEEAEKQLLEVQEFVRVAAMNIFTETAGAERGAGGPTLH